MLDLNIFYNKDYRNLNFMVTVYKFRKIYACNDFSTKFRKKITLRYIKIGYNTNVIRQTACMVVNPITVYNFASLFDFTPVGWASDAMTATV